MTGIPAGCSPSNGADVLGTALQDVFAQTPGWLERELGFKPRSWASQPTLFPLSHGRWAEARVQQARWVD